MSESMSEVVTEESTSSSPPRMSFDRHIHEAASDSASLPPPRMSFDRDNSTNTDSGLEHRVVGPDPNFAMPENYRMSEEPEAHPHWVRFQMWYRWTQDRLLTMWLKRYYSYYWRHLTCWVLMAFSLSGLMYATGDGHLAYIDALFYTSSAITATGLETTDLSRETTGTQILLFFCMLISGTVFESMVPLCVRLWQIRRHRQKAADVPNDNSSDEEKYTCLTLLVIIASYFFLMQVLSFLILGLYFQFSSAGSTVMARNGINAWWFNLFQTASSFQNCGFGLLVDSLVQVNSQILPLLVYGALILLGNTGYPILLRAILRFIVWALSNRRQSPTRIRLENVLNTPRNYMTHLFPAHQTKLLLMSLMFLTLLQTMLMCALDNDTPTFLGLSDGYIFANGLFQSIAVRTAGANSIVISSLKVESLVLMIGMMYLSVYPVTVSVRSTNTEQDAHKQNATYQLRRLLMQDALWVFASWYVICAIEGFTEYENGFKTLFEVCSAFGTVGLSIGVTFAPYHFCGTFSVTSKLIIIMMMLLGRHRGMPDRLDAVFMNAFRPPTEVKSRHIVDEDLDP